MRKTKTIAAVLGLCCALILLPAMTCAPSAQTASYNTLSSVQLTTSGAYNAYLDLVIQGKIATNMVPTISRDYSIFMAVWSGAVSVAETGVIAPATPSVAVAAATVIADINIAKAAKGVAP